MTREELLNAVMTRPETVRIKGHDFRKLDLAALAVLSELGNPLADISGDVNIVMAVVTVDSWGLVFGTWESTTYRVNDTGVVNVG